MVSAVTPQGTVAYTYNAEGLRVSQSRGGVVSEYTWDWATPVVPELLSDGDALYLVGHDTLGWTAGATWTYALPDALGSVRQEVDAAGALLDAREPVLSVVEGWSPYGISPAKPPHILLRLAALKERAAQPRQEAGSGPSRTLLSSASPIGVETIHTGVAAYRTALERVSTLHKCKSRIELYIDINLYV
jgi:hypothetical protein